MPSSGMRVSAIVPAYNRAGLLEETLRSLMAQRMPPHEVIVVDDGSDENIAGVAARFCGKVRYVRTANGGAPAARNLGASLATGDWLWFCDSDDLWHPTYLGRALRLAASDDVAILIDPAIPGDTILGVAARDDVPAGHKVALHALAAGAPEAHPAWYSRWYVIAGAAVVAAGITGAIAVESQGPPPGTLPPGSISLGH